MKPCGNRKEMLETWAGIRMLLDVKLVQSLTHVACPKKCCARGEPTQFQWRSLTVKEEIFAGEKFHIFFSKPFMWSWFSYLHKILNQKMSKNAQKVGEKIPEPTWMPTGLSEFLSNSTLPITNCVVLWRYTRYQREKKMVWS